MGVTTVYEGTDTLLGDVARVLRDYFGENLIALVAFGSYARGEAAESSDCDLYLIAKELPRNRLERAGYVNAASYARFDRAISIKADTKTEFEAGFPSLYLDLALDGIILFDMDDYIQEKLARILELTSAAGLYRVRFDGQFAWEWLRPPKPHWVLDWEGFRELA